MHSFIFPKIIYFICLCYLVLNIEARHNNFDNNFAKKNNNKCYYTLTTTKTTTSTATVTTKTKTTSTTTTITDIITSTTTNTVLTTVTPTCAPDDQFCSCLDSSVANCCSQACICIGNPASGNCFSF
ncbi:hypothetical protein F8M41_021625 [Gigaspora margarita]|uniref:Uncharacterized protein n=1 Tax=Gigaspora margarita TaxID=4874 RepID=A0A8H4ETT5_GIGMA|nr:hypothetical protein F8M41_021625 [Gigaspora margarita]